MKYKRGRIRAAVKKICQKIKLKQVNLMSLDRCPSLKRKKMECKIILLFFIIPALCCLHTESIATKNENRLGYRSILKSLIQSHLWAKEPFIKEVKEGGVQLDFNHGSKTWG